LSSEIEKIPRRYLHRVVEHPADSGRSFLSKRVPGGHQILHLREKEKRVKSLRGLSSRKYQEGQRPARSVEVK
jgi:hypothetical protein